jgi:hypothetical protein
MTAPSGTKYPSTYVPRPRSEEIEGRFGQIVIAWGALERELSMSFALVYRMPKMMGMCLAANMGTMAKVDALRSGVGMYKPLISSRLIDAAIKELNAVARLTGDIRTPIAHGQPWRFSEKSCPTNGCDKSDNGGDCWHWLSFRSRSTHSAFLHLYEEADFNETITELDRVTLAWHRSAQAIGRAVRRLSDRDLDDQLTWD